MTYIGNLKFEDIYTAQVKPTTVAMAMWYRVQTATPLVALMINAVVRSLTGLVV